MSGHGVKQVNYAASIADFQACIIIHFGLPKPNADKLSTPCSASNRCRGRLDTQIMVLGGDREESFALRHRFPSHDHQD